MTDQKENIEKKIDRWIKSGRHLRLPLFLMFSFIFLTSVSIWAILDIQQLNERLNNVANTASETIMDELDDQIIQEQNALSLALIGLTKIQSLQEHFQQQDRVSLTDTAIDLYQDLNATFNVTHLYFINLDREVFLRVHNPDSFGDTNNRYTMQRAEAMMAGFGGLEIGQNGALTLRVVTPWRSASGELIGFLEIGKEINHILQKLQDKHQVFLVESYRKSHLESEQFIDWMARSGKSVNWAADPDNVVLNNSPIKDDVVILNTIKNKQTDNTVKNEIVGSTTYSLIPKPLNDVQGQSVGNILIIKNISGDIALFWRNLVVDVLILVFAVLVILYFTNWMLKLVERRVRSSLDHLEKEVQLRTQDLEEGNKQLQVEISNHKKTADILQAAMRDAEHANKTKSDFLANMSHELRTPLNAIIGYSEFLQLENKPAMSGQQIERVSIILDAGKHLLAMVDSILDLAKVETKGAELNIEVLDPNQIIRRTIDQVSPLAHNKSVRIVLNESCTTLPMLMGDSVRLQQVISNLLTNGIKYNKPNGMIEIKQSQIDDRFLRLHFNDTGIGISKPNLKRIFSLFEQVGTDAYVTKDGYGMGLTISRMLMEQMGGKIGVDSQEGIGSQFWIDIPLAEAKNIHPFVKKSDLGA